MKKTTIALLGILALSLAVSCGRGGGFTPVVVLTVGDVQVKSQGKEFAPAKVAQVILKGDVIMTGTKSHITIQIGERGIVQISPDSTVEAASLFEAGTGELYLTKGTVVSRLDKLGKSNAYRVKTPTAIAAVRGTVFSVSYDSVKCSVGVSRGQVQVTDAVSGKAEPVVQGKAVDVQEGITLRDLAKEESLVLSKAEAVTIIEETQTVAPAALEEKGRSFLPAIEEIDRKIEELPPTTMEGIRSRYGRVDVVSLYSGRVYRGAIISRGATVRIITPQGTVDIPREKVKSTMLQ
ncbi:MAG: FecR domain-containing protein [Spirochaetes bacterium]|nr:FecR domain-containing protein [Spirochaetota bacterium]